MRTRFIIIPAILSLALVMGISRADELDESYYPLKEGRLWEYRVTTDKGADKKLIITNLAPREVNERQVTPRKWELGGAVFYELMYKDDSGIYRLGEQTAENAPPVILSPKEYHLKFPVAKGTTWNMTTKVGDAALTLNLTVESVSEKVTVPAGAFQDCVKVAQEGASEAGVAVTGYEWYAPKVGVVKSMVTIKRKAKDGAITAENRTYQLEAFKP